MARVRTAKHPKAALPTEPEDESQETPEEPDEQPQRTHGGQPNISKAEAVRQALSQGLDSLDDIEDFLKRRHGIEMPRPQISAYKAQAKKRAALGGAATPSRRGRKPRQAAESDQPAATPRRAGHDDSSMIDDLTAVKHLVQRLGADQVRKIVDLFE